MSTRGLIGYHLGGKDYVQYNHSDSYPTCLGLSILRYAKNANVDVLRSNVSKLIMVDEDKKPTKAQLRKAYPFFKEGAETVDEFIARSAEESPSWYDVLRNVQGNLTLTDRGMPFWMDYDGFQWSRSCEWAYILNLDTERLEVYTGHWEESSQSRYFCQKAKPLGRFATQVVEGTRGILLIADLPLAELKELSESAFFRYCIRTEEKYR
jgi:hypothetical protein